MGKLIAKTLCCALYMRHLTEHLGSPREGRVAASHIYGHNPEMHSNLAPVTRSANDRTRPQTRGPCYSSLSMLMFYFMHLLFLSYLF